MRDDFFSRYFKYTEMTEPPALFHRWSVIASIGALLGRQFYFQHGHFTVYPNIYCMLIGSAGSRKSTAIKLMKKNLIDIGYTTIAADKTTKEKFLLDLAGETGEEGQDAEQFLSSDLFGNELTDRETFVMADEFNDFFGNGNIEFISLLGTLWDYSGAYTNRIKNGKSISINNPTISILGGNTPTGFALAFPPEILGQGFFSRILLIYADPSGKRFAFPEPPSAESTSEILQYLQLIRTKAIGQAQVTPEAKKLLTRVYDHPAELFDVRFESYFTRRFTHLLKLCLIVAAARLSTTITESDVIYANTILTYAEHSMPKALGEFGKSKNSDVAHKIIQLAESSDHILTFRDFWRATSGDLERQADLATILQNLIAADKLQQVPEGKGFLPKRARTLPENSYSINFDLLSAEERRLIP